MCSRPRLPANIVSPSFRLRPTPIPWLRHLGWGVEGVPFSVKSVGTGELVAFCADLPVAPVSSLGRAPQVLAPARAKPPRWDKRGRPRPLVATGVGPGSPGHPVRRQIRVAKTKESHGEGVPIRVVVGAGLPSLVPFARGGWPIKNAKDPTCAPRLVGPLANLLEPTSMLSFPFFVVARGGQPPRAEVPLAPPELTPPAPQSRGSRLPTW